MMPFSPSTLRQALSSFAIVLMSLCLSALAQTPLPIVYQPLVPGTVAPGSPGFTLTVNGTGFVSGAVVYWNGNSRATTFVSSSQLTASISPADVINPSTASVSVKNPGQTASSNFVTLSITNPTPTLVTTQTNYSLSTGQSAAIIAVVPGDFNGDSKLDFAALSESNSGHDSVYVMLGNGDGSLRTSVQYVVGVDSRAMISGDFNGDGILDLVASNEGSGTLSILLGNGDGTFRPQPALSVGRFPRHLAAGDFNGDGKLDLAVACNNEVAILLGNGDGTFQTAINTVEPDGPNSITVGDFNGDGKLDVALGTLDNHGTGNTVTVYLGKGDGTFQPASHFSLPYYYGDGIATADVNGDGKLDIAVAGTFLAVLIGNGDGTFQPGVDYGSESLISSVAFGDFDGDGKLDILAAGDNSPLLYLGNGDGTFQSQIQFGSFFQAPTAAPADINNDGVLDFAVGEASSTGNLDLVLQGTFTFTPAVSFSPAKLNFGNVTVGQKATLTTTLTNPGTAQLIVSFGFRGTGSNQFTETDNCKGQVFPGANCKISVTFTPTSAETLQVGLIATDNAGSGQQMVPILAVGVQ